MMKEGKQRSNIKQHDDSRRPIKSPPSPMVDENSTQLNEIARLNAQINVLELALHHLYTNCPVTMNTTLKRHPSMLGEEEEGWMRTNSVFNVFARYGFDENYLNRLCEKFGEDDEC